MALNRYTITESGCWQWTGKPNRDGYGMAFHERRNRLAHIAVYEHERGPVPAGLVLDHLCRNRACVNPAHLEPVPQRVNVHRGASPAAYFHFRGTCESGHEFTERTTYLRKDGGRRCRICEAGRQRLKQYKRRKRAAKDAGNDGRHPAPLPEGCLP